MKVKLLKVSLIVFLLILLKVLIFWGNFDKSRNTVFQAKTNSEELRVVVDSALYQTKLVETLTKIAERNITNDLGRNEDSIFKLVDTLANNAKKDSVWVVKEYLEIYKKTKYPWWKELGWPSFILLIFFTAFRKKIEEWFSNLIELLKRNIFKILGERFLKKRATAKYLQEVIKKNQEVKVVFRPDQPLRLDKIYIPLMVKTILSSSPIDAMGAVRNNKRLVVKGAPGSGKSIFLKQTTVSFAKEHLSGAKTQIPIFIELWRFNEFSGSLEELILKVLKLDFPSSYSAESFLFNSLEKGELLIVLDGFDEVNSEIKNKVSNQIRDFLDQYSNCKALISCRTAVYREEFKDVVNNSIETVGFNDSQIYSYLQYWQDKFPNEKPVSQLILSLQQRPRIMALARNPLLLTIISYLNTSPGFVLPHSRTEFYDQAVDVLLRQWRHENNKYNSIKKRMILKHLALYNQDASIGNHDDRLSISYTTIIQEIKKALKNLDLLDRDAEPILKEIVERSGLLIEIDGGDKFQFTHLTLQEYFSASALREDQNGLIARYKKDPLAWRETLKLWCGLDIKSTPLIREIGEMNKIMALECLSDAKDIDSELSKKIIEECEFLIGKEETVLTAFAAIAADPEPARSQHVFESITNLLTEGSKEQKIAAARILSMTNISIAANILGRFYRYDFVREALLSMGDLALPTLIEKALAGNKNAIKDIYSINTLRAAESLVQFLWQQNREIAFQAAISLASLISSPRIERYLTNYKITDYQESASFIEWIWIPFEKKTPSSNSLTIIIGRISKILVDKDYGILNSENILSFDPRIVLPLTLVQTNLTGLENDIEIKRSLIDTLKKNKSKDDLRDAITQILTKFNPSNILNILKSQKLKIQLEIILCLLTNRSVFKSDWLKLFSPTSYKFKRSWHFYGIIGVTSMIPIFFLISIILNESTTLNNFLGLNFIFSITYWLGLIVYLSFRNQYINPSDSYLSLYGSVCLIFIPIMEFTFLSSFHNDTSMILKVCFTVLLFVSAISCIIIYWMSIKSEYESKNPLYQLLPVIIQRNSK